MYLLGCSPVGNKIRRKQFRDINWGGYVPSMYPNCKNFEEAKNEEHINNQDEEWWGDNKNFKDTKYEDANKFMWNKPVKNLTFNSKFSSSINNNFLLKEFNPLR